MEFLREYSHFIAVGLMIFTIFITPLWIITYQLIRLGNLKHKEMEFKKKLMLFVFLDKTGISYYEGADGHIYVNKDDPSYGSFISYKRLLNSSF